MIEGRCISEGHRRREVIHRRGKRIELVDVKM